MASVLFAIVGNVAELATEVLKGDRKSPSISFCYPFAPPITYTSFPDTPLAYIILRYSFICIVFPFVMSYDYFPYFGYLIYDETIPDHSQLLFHQLRVSHYYTYLRELLLMHYCSLPLQ